MVPEGVIGLGMQDLDGGVDENYLVPRKGEREYLQPLLGVARRQLPWIGEYLRGEGALVASRVTCGYARTLAAHIALVWPGLASKLLRGEYVLNGTKHWLSGVNYFFRRIASLDLLPRMGHCLTAIVTEGSGDGRQEWHEHLRGRRGRN